MSARTIISLSILGLILFAGNYSAALAHEGETHLEADKQGDISTRSTSQEKEDPERYFQAGSAEDGSRQIIISLGPELYSTTGIGSATDVILDKLTVYDQDEDQFLLVLNGPALKSGIRKVRYVPTGVGPFEITLSGSLRDANDQTGSDPSESRTIFKYKKLISLPVIQPSLEQQNNGIILLIGTSVFFVVLGALGANVAIRRARRKDGFI